MYPRKTSDYRPSNVPYESQVVQNFGAPAMPQMGYTVVPLVQHPTYGFIRTQVPQWIQQPSVSIPERNRYLCNNSNNSNSTQQPSVNIPERNRYRGNISDNSNNSNSTQQPSVNIPERNRYRGNNSNNTRNNTHTVYSEHGQSTKRPYSRPSNESYDDVEPNQKRRKPDLERIPPQLKDSMNNKITEGIWRYFEEYRQTDSIYRAKVHLRDALYVIFKDVFPYSGLYIVGSSMSGFATKTSDMDLCLMISHQQIDGRKEAVEILIAIQKCLRKIKSIKSSQVITARVPILKFVDYDSDVECDLNINNSVGIRNTHLLRYYAAMDWRVRPLVLVMKRWARFHDINDASKKTISSYSLCLMVIHYLQYGCNPPVLESIQKLYPNLFDYGDDIRNLKMNVKIEFKSKNSQSLGDLFLGLLKYFSREFNFNLDVISVRQGTKLPLHLVQAWTPSSDINMWKCLKVEEPFDKSNTARSCYDEKTFARVIRVFTRSYRQLSHTHNLDDILSAPF